MARAYSYDLRLRVINFLASGKMVKEAAKLYSISRKTVIEWKKLQKQTGDVKARTGYQKGHCKIIKDIERFKKFKEANYDKTTKELAHNWNQKVSSSTIARLLRKLGFSYKKNFLSPQKGYWIKK